MKSFDRHERLLAIGLCVFACYVDAIGGDALRIAAVARMPLAMAPPAA